MLIHTLPDVLTHTYHPFRGAFQNVCHLPQVEAESIIAAMRAETGSRRKPDYLDHRLKAEAWLIAERTRKLGNTPLSRPIYFFLGDMADGWDRSRPASITVPLSTFDASVITFTYSDSMASCPQPHSKRPVTHACHGKVYTLSEIGEAVTVHGFPDPKLPRNIRGAGSFIEAQVWDEQPLAGVLRTLAERDDWSGRPHMMIPGVKGVLCGSPCMLCLPVGSS